MGYKPNEGKGVTPEEGVLYYRRENADGSVDVATIQSFTLHKGGHYRAWVHTPQHATEQMDPSYGRLQQFTPVKAVLEQDLPALTKQIVADVVAAVAQTYEVRIAALEAEMEQMKADPVPTTTLANKAEPVAPTVAVATFACDDCGKTAKNAAGLASHRRACRAVPAQA